jgi:hypothetical protein
VLDIGQHMLEAIARLYRYEGSFRQELMQTLLREKYTPQAVHLWSSYLGAELGRLRVQVLQNEEAREFQKQTYHLTHTLPPITYTETDGDVKQTYLIASLTTSPARLPVNLQMLSPHQQDAWLVAKHIGEFGHPLVRKVLDQC